MWADTFTWLSDTTGLFCDAAQTYRHRRMIRSARPQQRYVYWAGWDDEPDVRLDWTRTPSGWTWTCANSPSWLIRWDVARPVPNLLAPNGYWYWTDVSICLTGNRTGPRVMSAEGAFMIATWMECSSAIFDDDYLLPSNSALPPPTDMSNGASAAG